MMLSKHADSETVVQEAIAVLKLELAHQGLHESRLTGSIGSDEGDTRVQVDVDIDSSEDW